ncbi:DUF4340 domain-containing protein [Defluviitalea phaphyphila]|uniref:DUF4340 domain-containing protein n=1 Tax=Defluviitalea phaphyphila TaxID=1473580 RepID=UPI00073080EC|nr:DUF4340 domain-containing protein [Defluviitalea phaphyphila]
MKKILPTILAIIMFIGVFIYYKNFQQKMASNNTDILLWEEDQNKIVSIDILNEDEKISIKRNGANWDIVYPINYPANDFLITNIISTFSFPTANELVEENPKDLSIYGLDSPIKSITLTNDENISNTLSFGNIAPFSKGYYILYDNKVYTASSSLLDNIPFDVNSLRDKKLFSFNEEYVKKVVIQSKDSTLTLSEEENLTPFISSLSSKIIKEFISDNANDEILEQYGLKEPNEIITIYLDDQDDSILTLYVGNVEEDIAYVTKDKKFIYKIDSTSLFIEDKSE